MTDQQLPAEKIFEYNTNKQIGYLHVIQKDEMYATIQGVYIRYGWDELSVNNLYDMNYKMFNKKYKLLCFSEILIEHGIMILRWAKFMEDSTNGHRL